MRRSSARGVDLSLYPALPHPAAFLCTDKSCSSPVTDEKSLVALIHKRLENSNLPNLKD